MVSFEEEVARFDPAIVAVLGDDPLTLRCALVAVEGRRPWHASRGKAGSDRFGRGSLNSRLCDHLATVVFTVCRQTQQNLLREGFSSERVVFVGSMVADVLQRVGASEPPIELPSEPYAVVVLGRSALDEYEDLRATVEAVVLLSRCAHVVIPLEQRARARLRQCGLEQALCDELGATRDRATGCPTRPSSRSCAVRASCSRTCPRSRRRRPRSASPASRSRTRRRAGDRCRRHDQIVGTDTERIVEAALTVLEGPPVAQPLPELWDGGASARIVAGLRGALRTPALTRGMPMSDAPAGTISDEKHDLDGKIVRGSSWIALSYGGRSVLSMLAMLVLARLLTPQAFGTVALASVFLLVLEHIQNSGVAAAVIYRRHGVEEAAASAFVFSTVVAVPLTAAAAAAAPLAAWALHAPSLTNVMRAMSLLCSCGGSAPSRTCCSSARWTTGRRRRASSRRASCRSGSRSGSPRRKWASGASCSARSPPPRQRPGSHGCRSLAPVAPARTLGDPARAHALRALRHHGNLVGLFNETVDGMAVARLLSTSALGYYTIAFRIASFPCTVIGYIVNRVMFPAYAVLQDDLPGFRNAFVQTLQRIALLSLPVGVILVVAARPIVLTLLGASWLVIVTPSSCSAASASCASSPRPPEACSRRRASRSTCRCSPSLTPSCSSRPSSSSRRATA